MNLTRKKILKLLYRRNRPLAPVVKYEEDFIDSLYPGMNRKDIELLFFETYSRNYVFEDFTHFKEEPYTGRFVNVDPYGFRKSKNQGPWPPQKDKHFSIFFFGSSTAFGYGVQDSETISSYFQELFPRTGLKRIPLVYNFGRGHYYSTEERILFEQLVAKGYAPDMAIFLDGLNEFFFYNDDGTAVSDRFEKLLRGDVQKLFLRELRKRSLILRTLRDTRKKVKRFFTKDFARKRMARYSADPSRLQQIIDRYMTNKKLIEAVGTAYNVRTVFVWEPIPTYRYDLALHPFAKEGFGRQVYSQSGYPMMAEYLKSHNPGNNFIWCADIGQDAAQALYVDLLHYSPQMSKMLAKAICDLLKARHLIPGDKHKK
jgi:lysophospholipase L1-like esterase